MKHAQTPLRDHLAEPEDERLIQRVWRGVEERRGLRTRRRRAIGLAGGVVTAAVGLILALRAVRPLEPGPLHRLEGGEPSVLAGAAAAETLVVLDDGSRVALAPAAAATVMENSGRSFVVALSAGRARFDVHPGGPRRWSIECGLATVEVVGTAFTIDRAPRQVTISVEHGVVLVRGERVPERVQRLVAGQSLRLGDIATATAALADQPAPEAPSALTPASGVEPPPAPPARPRPIARTEPAPWRQLVRGRHYDQAYGALGEAGIAGMTTAATPEDLLLLADVARLSGHPRDAILPLRRLIDTHPRHGSVPVALFTLGRVELDSLNDAAAAADAFAQALAAGVPQSLAEDAAARLVEARARAGQSAGARAAAQDYLRQFPGGRHVADVRRWAALP